MTSIRTISYLTIIGVALLQQNVIKALPVEDILIDNSFKSPVEIVKGSRDLLQQMMPRAKEASEMLVALTKAFAAEMGMENAMNMQNFMESFSSFTRESNSFSLNSATAADMGKEFAVNMKQFEKSFNTFAKDWSAALYPSDKAGVPNMQGFVNSFATFANDFKMPAMTSSY